MTRDENSIDAARLREEASAYRRSAVLLAGVETGIFQSLLNADRTAGELAEAVGGDRRGVGRLAHALVALGWLEFRDGMYHLPLELRPYFDERNDLSMVAILRHQAHLFRTWGLLAESALSGRPVRPERTAKGHDAFLRAMDDGARRGARLLWNRVEPPRTGVLLDVGGGAGRFALEAVRRRPGLRAVVVDVPQSEDAFLRLTAGRPEAARLGFVAADAMEGPLPNGDAALVSSLVHIYGPEKIRRLAQSLARALPAGGELIIRDFFFDDEFHTRPASTALFSINMLLNTDDGDCYSPGELREIFEPAGFGAWRLVSLDERSAALIGRREGL